MSQKKTSSNGKDPDPGTYSEFKLVSAGPGIPSHHIMKLPQANFDLASLQPPLKMYRRNPFKERREKWLAEQELERQKLIDQGVDPATLPPIEDNMIPLTGKTANVDVSKIAPFGQAVQKKQNLFKKKIKTFYLGREEDDHDESSAVVEEGEGGNGPSTTVASLYSRYGDPDRQPWVLQDAQKLKYHGSLEGGQHSSYALLVSSGPGQFTVIPASKWYKFVHQPNYRTLTADEVEEQLRTRKSNRLVGSSDRWLMKNVTEKEDTPTSSSSSSGKQMKSWKAKLLGFDTAEESTKPKRRPARRRDDDEPEGLDYDEEFADDEEIILGIEDKDEAKEASMRLYGRAGKASFDSDGDSDLESGGVSTKVGKKIAKTLRKIEKNDAYDFDEENPYLSEEEEDDDDEHLQNSQTSTTDAKHALLRKDKGKKIGSLHPSRNGSPGLDSSRAASPTIRQSDIEAVASKSDAKRKRYEDSQGDKKSRHGSPPPPPTAAEVVARIEKKRKGLTGRAISASPPPATGTPQSIGSPSPPPTGLETTGGLVLKEIDVVNAVLPENGTITVKQLVAKLQHFFKADANNKALLKDILKKLSNHDKASGKLTLKANYKELLSM